jgi:hypothetical protein
MGGENRVARVSCGPRCRRAFTCAYVTSARSGCPKKLRRGAGLGEGRTEGGIFSNVLTPCSTHPTRIPTGKSHFTGCLAQLGVVGCAIASARSNRPHWSSRGSIAPSSRMRGSSEPSSAQHQLPSKLACVVLAAVFIGKHHTCRQ